MEKVLNKKKKEKRTRTFRRKTGIIQGSTAIFQGYFRDISGIF